MGQSASKGLSQSQQVPQKSLPNADATEASKSVATAAAAGAPQQQRQPDKLKDGPCAQIFEDLEKCARAKGITKHSEKLQACPTETDQIIKCLNKNPEYFLK